MIVAATFSGHLEHRQLFWTLDVSGDVASVNARWSPKNRGQKSAAANFKISHLEVAHSYPAFLTLQRRYPSSLDGASVRDLSISYDGAVFQCSVHGSPSLNDYPELAEFNAVWQFVERLVHEEIGWRNG